MARWNQLTRWHSSSLAEQPTEQTCWVDVPWSMRSNASVLTCTLRPFRSNFQPSTALLCASHISPLTSNHRAAPSPDSNPCPLVSPGLSVSVFWTSGQPALLQVCRNIFWHVREGGGISFMTPVKVTHVTTLADYYQIIIIFSVFGSSCVLRPWSLCSGSAGLSRQSVSTLHQRCELSMSLLNCTLT